MKPFRTVCGFAAACVLAGAATFGQASAPALADAGFIYVNPGLNLQAGIDSGAVTLATSFFVPSVNVASTPNPTVDWGDGVVDSLTFQPLGGQECYVQGADIPAIPEGGAFAVALTLERCNLRSHHTYQAEGQYDIKVTYYTGAAVSYTTDVHAAVVPARNLVGNPYEITPLAGQEFNTAAASFVDDALSDQASLFTATIDWGDGATSDGTVTGANDYFGVNGTHTYASAGQYTVDTKVSYPDNTVDVYSTAVVAAPPTQTMSSAGLNGAVNQPLSGSLGTFTVNGNVVRPGDYRASIDWGDGTPPDTAAKFAVTAVPPASPLTYSISGSHTYSTLGQFNVVLTLNTLGGGDPATISTHALVTTCSTPSPATSGYAKAVLASAPAGYWRLDATCAADASGHGLNGQLNGNVGGITPGPVGAPAVDLKSSTVFDGISGAISLGDPAALQPAQVSVEAWINSTHGNGTVVRKRLYGYDLYVDSAGRPVFTIDDANATGYAAQGPSSVTDGKWHYLVGTYNGHQVCVYVDGTLAGSCAPAGAVHYAADQVAIGRDGSAPDGYFTGSIDDVAIYPKFLTAADVSAHFAASKQATTTTLATSGQGLTATVTGAGGITPSGSVTLKESGTTLQTAALSGSGMATFSLSGLATGSHSLVAVYNGDDPNSSTSTSSPISVAVSAVGTTTSLSTSNNNAPHFATITLTATVQATAPGTPTGSVTFMDGSALLGTAALNNGVATFAAKPGVITPGVHSITAVYAGQGKFAASHSQAITQIVQGNS
jgi:hypothetical protein